MTSLPERVRALAAVLLLAGTLAGCDGILDVENPTVVTPESLNSPEGVSILVNGVVGNFQRSMDDYVIGSGLLTDELVNAGGQAAPGYRATDERTVSPAARRLPGVWADVQLARRFADDADSTLRAAMDDPDFAGVTARLERGIATARLYRGYTRLLLAELYCRTVIEDDGPARSPAQAAQRARELLAQAADRASNAGLTDVVRATRVGRARAHAYLGNYAEARALAAEVPSSFAFPVEYSSNSIEQENTVFQVTHGVNDFLNITVGDGTDDDVHRERWPYFDEWVEQGLVDPDPGREAFDAAVDVNLQHRYVRGSANMVLASGWEARMIQAEAALRSAEVATAEELVGELLRDPEQQANPILRSNSALQLEPFRFDGFTGTLSVDLERLARARAAGLWLTGTRQGLLRRLEARDAVELYPPETEGDATCLPIPEEELDNNPNL